MKRLASSLLLLALLLPTLATAQLTPEAMIGLRRVGAPAVSPDGQTVLFTVTEVSIEANRGTTQVYAVPVRGGEPKALTEGASASSPVWRPDGKRIGFMRGGQFWEMDPDGGNAAQLTDIEGGLSNVKYSPKGTHILFTRQVKVSGLPITDDGDVRIVTGLMYKHWDNWEDDKVSHVFFAPYAGGKVDMAGGGRHHGRRALRFAPEALRRRRADQLVAGRHQDRLHLQENDRHGLRLQHRFRHLPV